MTVIPFTGTGTVGDGTELNPDVICENAKGCFTQVVIAGFNQDGEIEVRGSHGSRDILWILHRAIVHLLMETQS